MATHNELGKRGEQIAENYLITKEYRILHTNWRYAHQEVDIIAEKEGVLVFVEVKTRRNKAYGAPEEAVSLRKQQFLKIAAEHYLEEYVHDGDIRFDVVAIYFLSENNYEVRHLEDVFFHT